MALALDSAPSTGGAPTESFRLTLAPSADVETPPMDRADAPLADDAQTICGAEALSSLLQFAPQRIASRSGGEGFSARIDGAAGSSAASLEEHEFLQTAEFPPRLGLRPSDSDVAAPRALRLEPAARPAEPLLTALDSSLEMPATTVEQPSRGRALAKFAFENKPDHPMQAVDESGPPPASMLDASQPIAAPPAENGPSAAKPLERRDAPARPHTIVAETFERLQAFRDEAGGVARVVQHDPRRIELLLDPPDLGKVAVDLTVGEADVVTAVVTGESSEALRFMRHAAETIRDAMPASAEIRFEFREGRADAQDARRDADRRALRIEREFAEWADLLVVATPVAKPLTSRLDLRV
jgi:hypothetical protein